MEKRTSIQIIILFLTTIVLLSCSNYGEKQKLVQEHNDFYRSNENLRSLEADLMSKMITISLEDYDERNTVLSFDIYNHSSVGIKNLTGFILISNKLNDPVCDFTVEIDIPIPPKTSKLVSFYYDCYAYRYELSELRCKWRTDKIIFEDDFETTRNKVFLIPTSMINEDDIKELSIKDIQWNLDWLIEANTEIRARYKKYYNY